MQKRSAKLVVNSITLLWGLASVANAHGHAKGGNMEMGGSEVSRPVLATATSYPETISDPQTYFQYGEHTGVMVAHIVLMTLAWVFILPIGELFEKYLVLFGVQMD